MERIVCLVMGYICGLFQTGYLIGKLHKTDIRQHGSGNAGTTNAFRTFGKKAGALTLLGDCLKCIVAVVIVRLIYQGSEGNLVPLLTLYASLGCILGHNFPVMMEFRGGKGIAASVGMIIAFDWRIFLVCAVVFFALFFTTHYVSLCSLSAYAAAFILVLVLGSRGMYGMDQGHTIELYVVMGILTAMAFYRHRANIKRLLHGTESKVFLKKKE